MSFINIESKTCYSEFYNEFSIYLNNYYDLKSKIVIVCIGTDRSTGDSLGPIIGYKLKPFSRGKVEIYGTLSEPVHAKNLNETIKKIYQSTNNPFIIAIDACLGSLKHVGHISIGSGPIMPGAGVSKKLPAIGDMYITGIVNISGFMEFMVLQNTRLSTVMKMADIISYGIMKAIINLNVYNEEKA